MYGVGLNPLKWSNPEIPEVRSCQTYGTRQESSQLEHSSCSLGSLKYHFRTRLHIQVKQFKVTPNMYSRGVIRRLKGHGFALSAQPVKVFTAPVLINCRFSAVIKRERLVGRIGLLLQPAPVQLCNFRWRGGRQSVHKKVSAVCRTICRMDDHFSSKRQWMIKHLDFNTIWRSVILEQTMFLQHAGILLGMTAQFWSFGRLHSSRAGPPKTLSPRLPILLNLQNVSPEFFCERGPLKFTFRGPLQTATGPQQNLHS